MIKEQIYRNGTGPINWNMTCLDIIQALGLYDLSQEGLNVQIRAWKSSGKSTLIDMICEKFPGYLAVEGDILICFARVIYMGWPLDIELGKLVREGEPNIWTIWNDKPKNWIAEQQAKILWMITRRLDFASGYRGITSKAICQIIPDYQSYVTFMKRRTAAMLETDSAAWKEHILRTHTVPSFAEITKDQREGAEKAIKEKKPFFMIYNDFSSSTDVFWVPAISTVIQLCETLPRSKVPVKPSKGLRDPRLWVEEEVKEFVEEKDLLLKQIEALDLLGCFVKFPKELQSIPLNSALLSHLETFRKGFGITMKAFDSWKVKQESQARFALPFNAFSAQLKRSAPSWLNISLGSTTSTYCLVMMAQNQSIPTIKN